MPARSSASPRPPSPTASACSKGISAPTLFERGRRSVRLNRRGRAYYEEVRRILLDIRETTARHADGRRFRGR